MATPNITLTVTLQDFTGADVENGALLISLCNYGQILPKVVGTSMLARVNQTFKLATGSTTGIQLYGNDQIEPFGPSGQPLTFYAISIMDDKKNVLQSGIYQFFGTQTIDLSNAAQLDTAPLPGLPYLRTDPCAGAVPGSVYTLPHNSLFPVLIAVYYNGGWIRPGVDYNFTLPNTITLTFETEAEDTIYATYISSN
jgi:hypothetical protein